MCKHDERYVTNMTNPLKRIYIIKSNSIRIYKIPLKIISDLFLTKNTVNNTSEIYSYISSIIVPKEMTHSQKNIEIYDQTLKCITDIIINKHNKEIMLNDLLQLEIDNDMNLCNYNTYKRYKEFINECSSSCHIIINDIEMKHIETIYSSNIYIYKLETSLVNANINININNLFSMNNMIPLIIKSSKRTNTTSSIYTTNIFIGVMSLDSKNNIYYNPEIGGTNYHMIDRIIVDTIIPKNKPELKLIKYLFFCYKDNKPIIRYIDALNIHQCPTTTKFFNSMNPNLINYSGQTFSLSQALFSSNNKEYIDKHYKMCISKNNKDLYSRTLLKLLDTKKTFFTKQKVKTITVLGLNAYYIIDAFDIKKIKDLIEYMNTDNFTRECISRSPSSNDSYTIDEKIGIDFSAFYNRQNFFFLDLKKTIPNYNNNTTLIEDFRQWIVDLGKKLDVDIYIEVGEPGGIGRSVQLNIVENQSFSNMNMGLHNDYTINTVYDVLPSYIYKDKEVCMRTIILYMNLMEDKKPVIGLTTLINGDNIKGDEYNIRNLVRYKIYAKYIEDTSIEFEYLNKDVDNIMDNIKEIEHLFKDIIIDEEMVEYIVFNYNLVYNNIESTRLLLKQYATEFKNIHSKYIAITHKDRDRLSKIFLNFVNTKYKLSDKQSIIDNFINKICKTVPIIKGEAGSFKNGSITYFNGILNHSVEAGIGKRVSIVYKVCLVGEKSNITIEDREKIYFNSIQNI